MPSEYINSDQDNRRSFLGSVAGYMFNPVVQTSDSLFGIWSYQTWRRAHNSTNLNVNPFWALDFVSGGTLNKTMTYFANQSKSTWAKSMFHAFSGKPISVNAIAGSWVEGMLERAGATGKEVKELANELVKSANIRGKGSYAFRRGAISESEFNTLINKSNISQAAKKLYNNIDKTKLTSVLTSVGTFGKYFSRIAAVAEPIGWALFAYDVAKIGVKGATTIYNAANNINQHLQRQIEEMRSLEFNQPLTYGYQSQTAATERQMAVRAIQQTGGRIGSYMFGNESKYYSR